MMKTKKSRFARTLENIFPRTMHRYWWQARRTGRNYGVNLALVVLNEEMKRLHKDLDTPILRVRAKEEAKYLQTLIRKVRALNDAK